MKKTTLLALCLSLAAGAASAQSRPGPEIEVLKADVGTWDATVELFAPGTSAPMTSAGTETNTLLAGAWLITDFKGEMMGAPFAGHGVTGWDTTKKKYVGTWVDSMSVGLSLVEATYDAATKTMAGTMEGPDPSGQVQKLKSTVVYKDAGTRVFTLSSAGPDGKDVKMMTITYKLRK